VSERSQTPASLTKFLLSPADGNATVSYRCRRKLGAFLSLPHDGLREDVIRTKAFEDYIRDHSENWFAFAQRNRLDVQRMEDIILVSGCTLVTAWAAAAFVDSNLDAEISLGCQTLRDSGVAFQWHFARETSQSVATNSSQGRVRRATCYDLDVTDVMFFRSLSHLGPNAYSSGASEQSASS
jgi:hypothetical protein